MPVIETRLGELENYPVELFWIVIPADFERLKIVRLSYFCEKIIVVPADFGGFSKFYFI